MQPESTTVMEMTEEISDGRTKSFTKVSHGYRLDLGYCTAGTQVRIKNSNEERVNITAYALNLDAADTAYQTLNEQTMEMTSFSDTKITGTIDVRKEGRLLRWRMMPDGNYMLMENRRIRKCLVRRLSAHILPKEHIRSSCATRHRDLWWSWVFRLYSDRDTDRMDKKAPLKLKRFCEILYVGGV